MMNWFKKNDFFLKLLSFLIALIVWMYVGGANDFKEEYKVNDIIPEFTGVDSLRNSKNLVLVGDYFVDIELSGTYSALLSLNEKDIKVEADLERMGITNPGTYEVPYTVKLPSSDYSLKWKNPQKLTVTLDKEKNSVVPVRIETSKIAAKDFIVNDVKHYPKELRLSGLQADIEKISYAQVNTGKENMKSMVSGEYQYKFYDAEGNQLKDLSVDADYDVINVTIPVLKTKSVPLRLELQVPVSLMRYINYSFSPEKIVIAGDENVINETPEIVVGTVNVSELSSLQEKSFTIIPAEGIINLSGENTAVAEIKLDKTLISKTVTTSQIKVVNADKVQGKIELVTTSLPITVFGTEESISKIAPEKVSVVADLGTTILNKGKYTLETYVETGGVQDVIVANPESYKVVVEVK